MGLAYRMLVIVAVAGAALAPRAAWAQAGADEPMTVRPPPKPRSPGTAMVLSGLVPAVTMAAGATLIASGGDGVDGGLALTFAGGIVGPSAGLWYAGHRGGLGLLARTGATGVIAYGARIAYADNDFERCEAECTAAEREENRRDGQYLMYAGAGLWLISTIADVRGAERAAIARNRARAIELDPLAPPGLVRRKKGRNPDAAMALTLLLPAATIAWGRVMLTDDDLEPLGWLTIATGVVIGPSAGVWYAGHGGGKGMTLRMLIGLTGVIGGVKAFDDSGCFFPGGGCDELEEERREGRILFGLSAAAWAASVLYDMRAAGRATGRWNERRGLSLTPMVVPATRGRATGLMLSTTF